MVAEQIGLRANFGLNIDFDTNLWLLVEEMCEKWNRADDSDLTGSSRCCQGPRLATIWHSENWNTWISAGRLL